MTNHYSKIHLEEKQNQVKKTKNAGKKKTVPVVLIKQSIKAFFPLHSAGSLLQ
jgi:hypothetical protein